MQRPLFDTVVWLSSVAFLSVLVVHEASAEPKTFTSSNAKWKSECSSCHLAYPPELLPAASWRSIMSGLGKHFGVDASVDAASAAEIGAFLQEHAASGKFARTDALRITDTAWFRDQHDEMPAAVWKHPSVRSPANCAACHRAAGEGDFRERNVRVPGGRQSR